MLNLIDHLPRNSSYHEALSQDDELAQLAAEQPGQVGSTEHRPPLSEWSPEVDLLAQLLDVVQLMRAEAWSLAGQKNAPTYAPTPRPKTTAERAKDYIERSARQHLIEKLYPEGR